MKTQLRLKAGILQKALAATNIEPEPMFVISANEFSFYSLGWSAQMSCELKPEGEVSESSNICGITTALSFQSMEIEELLRTKTADDDIVIITISGDEHQGILEFEIENKPAVRSRMVGDFDVEIERFPAAEVEYQATVTLSARLFNCAIRRLIRGQWIEADYEMAPPGHHSWQDNPSIYERPEVKITLTPMDIQFTGEDDSFAYEMSEVEDDSLSLNVKKSVSVNVDLGRLCSFIMITTDAKSVTISALPGRSLRVDMNIVDDIVVRFDLPKALPYEGDIVKDDVKKEGEALLDDDVKRKGKALLDEEDDGLKRKREALLDKDDDDDDDDVKKGKNK